MAGSITKVNNVTYRFSVMRDGKRFTKQVKCENVKNDFKNDKKLQELLKEFIEETEKTNYNSKDYRLIEYSDIWVKDVLTNNFSPVSVAKNNSYLKNRIIPFFRQYKNKRYNTPSSTSIL